MKIDKKQLIGKESDIRVLRRKINDTKGEAAVKIICYENLLDHVPIDWDGIKLAFTNDGRTFEKLLFQIYFKRDSRFLKKQRQRILTFLTIAYQYTRDVRYFNEFLWFYDQDIESQSLWFLTLDNYFCNLSKKNHHHFPLCEIQEIQDFIHETSELVKLSRKEVIDPSLRIGLFGAPTFSPMIRNRLTNHGLTVTNYHIPFHMDKKINFVFRSKITFWLFCLMKRVNWNFITLNYNYKDPKIGDILKAENLDIGFHKFSFIIKNNIIDALRIGLINDHLAILPYIRGRSVVEYSLLFGVPIAATTHLVDEGIDTGSIINIYPYPGVENRYSTVKQIGKFIRKDRNFRAVDSIEILARSQRATIGNETEKGRTFYSIHPSLVSFIDENILKRSAA